MKRPVHQSQFELKYCTDERTTSLKSITAVNYRCCRLEVLTLHSEALVVFTAHICGDVLPLCTYFRVPTDRDFLYFRPEALYSLGVSPLTI